MICSNCNNEFKTELYITNSFDYSMKVYCRKCYFTEVLQSNINSLGFIRAYTSMDKQSKLMMIEHLKRSIKENENEKKS